MHSINTISNLNTNLPLPERIKEILNAGARSEMVAACELSRLFDSLCSQGLVTTGDVEEISELCRDVIRVCRRFNRNVRRVAQLEEALLRKDEANEDAAPV